MADIELDVAVLGWGKGGKTRAGALGRAGKSVAMVERSPRMYGGTCITINCASTKALIHQAGSGPDGADAVGWFAASVGRRDSLVANLRARNLLREAIWTHPSTTEAFNEVLAGLRRAD